MFGKTSQGDMHGLAANQRDWQQFRGMDVHAVPKKARGEFDGLPSQLEERDAQKSESGQQPAEQPAAAGNARHLKILADFEP